MDRAVTPPDFRIELAFEGRAPQELRFVAERYWALLGFDPGSEELLWECKTTEIPYASWSSSAHYAAAAAATATAGNFRCSTCDGPLTLGSRNTLANAVRGTRAVCRSCDPKVDAQARKVLDPQHKEGQQAKRGKEAAAQHAQEQAREAALAQRAATEDFDLLRRAAIEARYPSETDDDGEYAIDIAPVTTRAAALSIIHAAGQTSGLIAPISYHDASIAPDSDSSREFFVAAWHSDILAIHPGSPTNGFVWESDTSSELGNGIYVDRINFMAPGEGPLARRLDHLSNQLRSALDVAMLHSGQRRELLSLAKRMVTEEAIRHFAFELSEHGLPSPVDQHWQNLKSHTEKAADLFALGNIYKFSWMAARDAISAYQRISGMSREKATAHAVNKFLTYVQRAVDDPTFLGDPYRERYDLPLSGMTDCVYRVVLGLDPFATTALELASALEGHADAELIEACDAAIPDPSHIIEWLRTTNEWEPTDFLMALHNAPQGPRACAPGCAHERSPEVAHQASVLFERIVALIGDRAAAIATAEALRIGNPVFAKGKAGDLVLSQVGAVLGWRESEFGD